ncbi:hypothetical protein Syun_031164 [Stephania yunnanensis]|uniref:Uncharacterized protein n=1 Tax=Stephania yunnanensis TaxID=152371 RepID=A0AAP0HF51_9MAGN
MSHCPLLLCLVGDRSVRQRATAPLLHVVHRAAADFAGAAICAPPPIARALPSRPPLPTATSPLYVNLILPEPLLQNKKKRVFKRSAPICFASFEN